MSTAVVSDKQARTLSRRTSLFAPDLLKAALGQAFVLSLFL